MSLTFGTTRSAAADRERVAIYGVPVDRLSYSQTLERLTDFVEERKERGPSERGTRFLATANVDFVVQAMENLELRRILVSADVVTADGMPVVWMSHLLGAPIQERVTGVDLVRLLVQRAASRGWSVFFLGGADGVAEEAARYLALAYPGLRVAGTYSPPYAPVARMDNEAICERINASGADLLLVAYGCPKQETWIYANRHRLNVGVACGVGGSFDLIAGRTPRAPAWLQRVGGEWIYRMFAEPRRLARRYAKDLASFGPAAFRQLRMHRKTSRRAGALSWTREGEPAVYRLSGVLAGPAVAELRRCLVGEAGDVVVHLGGLDGVDALGAAALLDAWKFARDAGRSVVLCGGGPARLTLAALGATEVMELYADEVQACRALGRRRGRAPGYRLIAAPSTAQGRWRLVLTGEVTPELACDMAERVLERLGLCVPSAPPPAVPSALTVEVGGLAILDASVAAALARIHDAVVRAGATWKLVGLDAYGRRAAGEAGIA